MKEEFGFPYLKYRQVKVKDFKTGLIDYMGDDWEKCLVTPIDFKTTDWQIPKRKAFIESTYVNEGTAFRYVNGYLQTLYFSVLGIENVKELFEGIKDNILPIETDEEIDFDIHCGGISSSGGRQFEGQDIANTVLEQHGIQFGFGYEGEMRYKVLCPNMMWRYFFKDAYRRLQLLKKIHKKIVELQEKAIPIAIASFLNIETEE